MMEEVSKVIVEKKYLGLPMLLTYGNLDQSQEKFSRGKQVGEKSSYF
jgi:hypothetical protein